jgi:hypothetical protein
MKGPALFGPAKQGIYLKANGSPRKGLFLYNCQRIMNLYVLMAEVGASDEGTER